MYRITHENDEVNIRFEKDLVDGETLTRFLNHINLQSMMKKSTTSNTAALLRARNRLAGFPTGVTLLRDPTLNKGSAFTEAEREALGLSGLLPPRVHTMEEQVQRVLENLRKHSSDLDRYVSLIALQDRNKTLFYRVLLENIDELMPIVYTPTVGQACMEFGHIFRRPRGIYITANDRGRVAELLGNWPFTDIRIIVVTDGERILGLGDLGADGMGIPVGKLSLYTACAGIDPNLSLPVTLDLGTDNARLLNDPLYTGLRHPRLRGQVYDDLLEEFVLAVQQVYPGALIQFEDFANRNAFHLLQEYRDQVCCFNDDIQGTAGVALAGLLTAGRITGKSLAEQRVLFLGAGSAATGIADLFVSAMVRDGVSAAEARRRCWFVDSKGLVVEGRADLAEHKLPYAHPHAPAGDLLTAIEALRPTALIGASAQGGTFTEAVVRAMARHNERPIVFPLSNPTSKSECTAQQAYEWSDGRAVFASGSPFPACEVGGRKFVPGQGNNAYIFPGLGLGAVVAGVRRVTDTMFYVAARTLAELVDPKDLEFGLLYPRLAQIRTVSAHIATAVAANAYEEGLATAPRPADLGKAVAEAMYDGRYPNYA